jgi:hypothetical protein
MLTVRKLSFDGIAGESTYYLVGPDQDGDHKEFSGLLQGGLPFPWIWAHLYALTHR